MGVALATVGEISFKDGRVEQDNFHNYEVTRMEKAPREIHVHIIPGDFGKPLGGVGEPGVPRSRPRCATRSSRNGKRIRRLPIRGRWAFKREHRATVAHATSARKENAPPVVWSERRELNQSRAPPAWPPATAQVDLRAVQGVRLIEKSRSLPSRQRSEPS